MTSNDRKQTSLDAHFSEAVASKSTPALQALHDLDEAHRPALLNSEWDRLVDKIQGEVLRLAEQAADRDYLEHSMKRAVQREGRGDPPRFQAFAAEMGTWWGGKRRYRSIPVPCGRKEE